MRIANIFIVLVIGLIGLVIGNAFADTVDSFPTRPIKIIVSFTAGGTTDILTREVANQMSMQWKVPIIVENKPGAAGNLGTEIVGRSIPDGYTLLASSSGPIAVNPTLFKNLAVNPQKELQPIALLADVPNVLVIPGNSPVNNFREFLAYAKDKNVALNYGSTGIGTAAHLLGYLFSQRAGLNATHIPYKGAEATRDLVSGQLQYMFATAPSVIPLIKSGQLKAVAVSAKTRMKALPDVPILTEYGIDMTAGAWFGLFAPVKTDSAIVQKINETVVGILESPALKSKLLMQGADAIPMSVTEFAKFVHVDFEWWAPVVKASGARPE